MKFSEKLQLLRKEKGYSQEQLADLLEVSRQSVSKWESGTTYPEMDKLLAICKIFNITLDDLTNDEVTKNDIQEKKKNNFSNLVYTLLDMIDKSANMFKSMNSKERRNCIGNLLLVTAILLLFKIPFNYLDSLIHNLFSNPSFKIGMGFYEIFSFIISVIYLIFFVVVLVYFYKTRYLDKYDGTIIPEVKEKENEEVQQEVEEVKDTEEVKKEKKQKNFILFDILGAIFNFCIKFILVFVIIGLSCAFIAFVFSFVVSIILTLKGLSIIGLVIILLALVLGCGLFLDLGITWLFSNKIKFKRILITFLVSLILVGAGTAIFAYEVSLYTYIDGVSARLEKKTETKTVDMTEDFLIYNPDGIITYKENNELKDKVNINASYYANFTYPDFNFLNYDNNNSDFNDYSDFYPYVYHNYYYVSYATGIGMPKKIFDLVVTDLKEHKLYNYDNLFDIDIEVETSKENIEKIQNNIQKEMAEFEKRQAEIDRYYSRADELERENERLEQKIDEYENKIEELEEKVDNYKERIEEILED